MNKNLKWISAVVLTLATSSAFAWPQCKDGSKSLLAEGSSNYVCPCGNGVVVSPTQSCPAPTPAPATPQPISATGSGTGTANSDADAAAQAKAEAEAKAAAASIAAALANGGNATGGNANAANDIFVKLSPEMQTKVLSNLSQEQRQALSNVNSNVNRLTNNSPSEATIGAGAGAGGGAQVSTTNINNIRNLTLAPISAQAPSLPHQMGSFSVQDGLCAPALTYKPFNMPIVHRRAFLPDTVLDMNTGLMVVDPDNKVKPTWTVLGTDKEGMYRVVQGEIARQVVGLNSVSGSDGMSLSFGNGNGAGGVGSSGSKANQFMAGYFMQPSVCYVKQTKFGDGWVPTDLIVIAPSTTTTSVGPTAEDVLAALAKARILLNVPTTTLVREEKPCKLEDITRADGSKETRCLGPKSGSYQSTRVVTGNVPVAGTLELGVAGKK